LKNDRNLNNPTQSGNATAQMQSGNATNTKKHTTRCDDSVPNTGLVDKKLAQREKGDWMLNPEIAKEIFASWGTPKIDLFASNANI
jgi:hypothetical protein